MEENEMLTKQEKRELAKERKAEERRRGEVAGKLKKYGFLLVVLGIVAFFGYRFISFVQTPNDSFSEPLEITDRDWTRGNPQAPIALVEYSDFQCPACANYYPILKQLLDEYPDELLLVYRHIPLVAIHTNAIPAAKAAEAAGLQDSFWEMHDVFFENQEDWERERNPKDKFIGYAEQLGLDEQKFAEDYESREVQERVELDMFTANRLRVTATPTFFLNGKALANVRGYEDLKSRIEAEIANLGL